jgi:periplasmic protein TonB
MTSEKILSADLLELVFDGRNKTYGAYELRKTYNTRITKAMLITSGIIVLAFGIALARPVKESDNQLYKLTTVIELEKIVNDPIPPPPVHVEPPPPERTVHDATIAIVPDELVTEPPPSIDDKQNANSDVFAMEGQDASGIAEPTSIVGNTGVIEAPQKRDTGPLTIVEVEAKFQGDWGRFLRKYLRGEAPIDKGAPAGRYNVRIQFVVDIDGTVSDIKPLTNVGYGMEEEAIRVIKKSDKWEPAIQNGYPVKAYRIQPITFEIPEE